MPTTSAQGAVQETNPVMTATAQPGMSSPLDFGDTGSEVTVTGGIGSGANTGDGSIDWSMFSDPTLTQIGNPSTSVTEDASVSSALSSLSSGSNLSSILSSLGLSGSNLGALAPELAVAGVGLAQAKGAQSDAAAQANSLKGPSQTLINQGQQQITQAQSGQLTPQQQQYVDFTTQEGQALIDSGAGLQAIATQAFGDYASGTLPQADQLKLDQQTAAQKQQIASQLGQSGMQDSSVLAAYNQQIDNQALITKQNLLDARFQTGVQAYNTWLTSTTDGIAVKNAGAQFAQTAFQDMMQNGLALESQGMAGLTQAIALTVQSDDQLSQSVSQLMGNLAAAYAYTVSGGGKGGAAGGAGGTAGAAGSANSILNSITSAGKTANTASNLFSGGFSLNDASSFNDVASGLDASTAATEASDLSGILGGFSSAGGGAAEAGLQQIGTGAVDQAVSGASSDAASSLAGDAGAGLGSYAGAALGAAGGALSLYNEVNSWQSGATGSDALSGAETGAAIGTMVLPGIGTAIGAVGGAIAGAVSALFGGGKVDPENASFEQYTQAFNKAPPSQQAQVVAAVKNPYVALAGYFDLRSSQLKGQNPIYSTYGRMGEQKFTTDLIGRVKQAEAAGVTDPSKVWSQYVNPWITAMGTWNDSNKGAMEGLIQNMTSQIVNGSYEQNFRAVGGQQVFT